MFHFEWVLVKSSLNKKYIFVTVSSKWICQISINNIKLNFQ